MFGPTLSDADVGPIVFGQIQFHDGEARVEAIDRAQDELRSRHLDRRAATKHRPPFDRMGKVKAVGAGVIVERHENGMLEGGADPRRDGLAYAF